jgi:2,4-dienoyl-CoA reductase-like NADH-dependent reductase (Old Yellow Enzyme family)/thioredoxin reductase
VFSMPHIENTTKDNQLEDLMAELNLLLQPGLINKRVTRNRIVMSSAITNTDARDGTVTDQTIAYYAERGRGGAGIVNTGYNFVCQRGRAGIYQMSTASDDMIPSMRRLTEAFHALAPDGMIGSQINHAGRQTNSHTTGIIPEGPSPIPGPLPTGHSMEIPEEMSVKRIHEMVDEFAQAARRSKEAGFDLVEVHAAHGYLLSQFISPYSNIRTDQYGGSLENRLRAVLEVLEACRGIVGQDYPLGVRINGDDMVDGGYTIEAYRIVAQLIERSGFADYISVTAGQHHPDAVAAMVAPMAMPLGFLEHLGAGVRSAVEKIPVFIVGRIKDPVQAENILQRGSADYVIMTRALMADPELPKKAHEGRLEDIRPCITCMQGCTDRTWSQLDLTCLVNPVAGREQGWSQLKPAAARKRVLVVGGGPAGMEAARIAALRGHDVTLWEGADRLGGATLLAAIPPRRDEFGDLPRWLSAQVGKTGVKVELNHKADAESVRQFAPDVLIAATGARVEIPEHIPGWNLPQVTTVRDLLSGKAAAGERVLVLGYDTQAVETAEWLAEQGKTVFLISGHNSQAWEDPEAALANDKNGFTARHTMMPFFREKVQFLPFRMIKTIQPGYVIVSKTGEQHPCTTHVRIGDMEDERMEIDSVVIHLRHRPVREWMEGLQGTVPEVYLIGDCLEPRYAIDAMLDGARVGRLI